MEPKNDEMLYRSFLRGDDDGLQILMERYGNSLTLYIDAGCPRCIRCPQRAQ